MEINSPAPHCAQDHICWGAHASHPDRHRLEVRNLSVYYGSLLALDGISFSITCGHTLALMGPNGAGKSTLIKALAGLLRPDSGEILWNGSPLHDTPGEIAYLPQRSDVDWSFPHHRPRAGGNGPLSVPGTVEKIPGAMTGTS